MKRFLGAMLGAFLVSTLVSPLRAGEKEASDIVDKAIKAMGGEEKLKKATTASWKTKGVLSFNGNDNEFSTQTTIQGYDKSRREFEGQFGDNKVMGITVQNGGKIWRKFGDQSQELSDDALANEKRRIYLQLAPFALLPLKEKGFKLDTADDEKVADKPASVVKVTGPDSKDFKIFFDKESSLPVKVTARVVGFGDQDEYDEEVLFSNYKDFDGIKKATKTETKRDGEKFVDTELTEFKVLDKVDAATFNEPQ